MSLENNLLDIFIILAQSMAGILVLFKLQKMSIKSSYKKIISLIIFVILMIFSNYLIPNQMRSLFTILSFTAISFFILQNSIKESLIDGMIIVALVAIVEIVFSFLMLFFGLDQGDLVEVNIWRFILNILISITIIIIINIKFILKFLLKFKDEIVNRTKLILYFLVGLILVYLIVARNALFADATLDMIINLIILFISMILFIIIFLSDNKNKYLQETNKQMLNYVTKYEKIITDQGKANHEFKNQLMVIRGYAQMNSSKLIEYLDSIVEDVNKTHSSYLISQLNKFPDGGIKGLLYYKLSIMDDDKIKYEINVESGVKTKLKTLNINIYKNITKILGVLLDNAIDASKNTKDKRIIISVSKNKNMVIFKIYNTYNGNVDISKIGTGYTTKGKGHGYGLKLVKDIIRENKIFEIKTEIKEDFYISNLIIKFLSNLKK